MAFRNGTAVSLVNYSSISRSFDFLSVPEQYAIGGYFTLTGVLGLAFNILTIHIIVRNNNVGKKLKAQMVNLAIADCLMAICIPPANILTALKLSWPNSLAFCAAYSFLTNVAYYVSPLCNAAISVELWFIVFYPLRANQLTRAHNCVFIAIIWLVGIAVHVPTATYSELYSIQGRYFCFLSPKADHSLYVWLLSLQFVIPTLVIVTNYIAILIKLQQRRRNPQLPRSNREGKVRHSQIVQQMLLHFAMTIIWGGCIKFPIEIQ